MSTAVLPLDLATPGGDLLVLALIVPVAASAACIPERRPQRGAHRARGPGGRCRHHGGHRDGSAAHRRRLGVRDGQLAAATRHRAAGRWPRGRDDVDERGGADRNCSVRTVRLRHPGRARRSARAVRVLDHAACGLGGPDRGVPRRRSVHSVRRARTAVLRCGPAGEPRRPRRDVAGCAPLLAVRTRGLGAVPAGRHADVRGLRHARHRAAGRAGRARAGGAGRYGADDGRPAGEDGALPIAPVAAARARRRAGSRERAAVVTGDQGIVLHRDPPVARYLRRRGHDRRGPVAGRAGCLCDRLRQCGRVAAGTLEADDCLLHRRANRLPLPDVPAGARCVVARDGLRGAGRRPDAGDLARDRQGRDVHGGGADLRDSRTRSRRRPGWHCTRAADDDGGLCTRRHRPDRPAAVRWIPREVAAAVGRARHRRNGGGSS